MDIKERKIWARNILEPVINTLSISREYRNLTEFLIDQLDDYWFIKPASSTGKYHPKFNNGEGGLVRHSLNVCMWWQQMYRAFEQELMSFSGRDDIYDLGLIACLFHDAKKYGDAEENSRWVKKDHDVRSMEWFLHNVEIYEHMNDMNFDNKAINYIANAIDHHNGPWSTHGAPRTIFEKLVFICDYASSQKIHEAEVFDVHDETKN